jgi:hypothetical protein
VSYSTLRIALVTVLALIVSPIAAAPASADDVAAHVGSARSESLPVIEAADWTADASAAAQAAAGTIFHTDLSGLLGRCVSAGEIVGMGPSLGAVFEAFDMSPPHRNILMNPAWNAIGTGRATGADGKVYVSVIFCSLAVTAEAVTETHTAAPPPIGPAAPPSTGLGEVAEAAQRIDIREWLDPQAASMLATRFVQSCPGRGSIVSPSPACLRAN